MSREDAQDAETAYDAKDAEAAAVPPHASRPASEQEEEALRFCRFEFVGFDELGAASLWVSPFGWSVCWVQLLLWRRVAFQAIARFISFTKGLLSRLSFNCHGCSTCGAHVKREKRSCRHPVKGRWDFCCNSVLVSEAKSMSFITLE